MNVSSVIRGETDIFFIKCDDISHKCSVALQNIFRFHRSERVKFGIFSLTTVEEAVRGKTSDDPKALQMKFWCQYCRFPIVVTNTTVLVFKCHSMCSPVRAKSNQ